MLENCPTCEQRDRDERYPKQLIPEITWPEGRTAVTIAFNYQGNEAAKAKANGRVDWEAYTEAEYGRTDGVQRVLRVLKNAGITTTWMVIGAIAERYPDSVLAIKEAGHEISGHGYHHEVATDISPEAEREIMVESREILKSVTGVDIQGWRSCHQSPNTMELAMDLGLKYNSNSFMYDKPFIVTHGDKSLVEVVRQPFGDMRTFGFEGFGGDPEVAYQIWKTAFDTLHSESEISPTFVPFSLHPFIIARPGRIDALARLIEHVQSHEGVWFGTLDQVADAARASADKATVPA